MSLTYSQVSDLVALTQEKLIQRGAFLDMQTDLQDHVLVRELWRGRKKVFDGGDSWRFDAQVDGNYSARAVALYETDGSSVRDTMISGSVQPRHVNAHYLYDLREPALQGGSGTKIVDYILTKRAAMNASLFEYLEEVLWGKPTDSSDDTTPYGVAYWVTRDSSEGFNGGNPSGFTSGKAGIDQGTYPRWANYTAQYADVTKEDLVRKMRRAHRQIQFRSPLSHKEPTLGGTKNGIYTVDSVIGLLEEILEAQNMNLGNDIASKDGKVTFKSTPITWVPYLDDDGNDPVYMLDYKWLALGTLPGWENNLTKPYMVPNKHNVRRVDLDTTLQMICTNLRRQAVISTA